MNLKKQLDRLCGKDTGYWCARLHGQVDYLLEALDGQTAYTPDKLAQVLAQLEQIKNENGALTKADVLAAEAALACYVPLARSFGLRMISHAHIDMNWQWGFEETVGVVIDTFRTMLRLLDEYPQFIFTQSQAAVYEIVEKYAPDLLPRIKERIRQGRWEVVASTWVEADKNLTNTESMARHILYTKQYLSKLLDLDPQAMNIDFEPDTFGHGRYTPEILSQGGVKYYYHCRGYDGEELYRWQSPSGSEVLALRDPQWYFLLEMDHHMAYHVPAFCRKNHTKSTVRFYGVGDHGGGPSRRDIERILDMQSWPLMPCIQFSTLQDFFAEAEQVREQLPVVSQELNCVFTGCYSAQARVKQANRQCEDHLYDAEALCAMAQIMGCELDGLPGFGDAWKNVLFNQFHDVLPGSGVRETREFALGQAQQTNALCGANAGRALRVMGERIATDLFQDRPDPQCAADSAGAGYNYSNMPQQGSAFCASQFCVGAAGGSSGLVRPYTIFNPTQYPRKELVELTVWDWPEPTEGTKICTATGENCPFDVIAVDGKYWHHTYCKLAFMAEVPAFGYANYYVTEADRPADRILVKGANSDGRVHHITDAPIVLENEYIRAVFDRCTMELTELLDKRTGTYPLKGTAGWFSFNREQDHKMSSWIVSPVGHRENLNRACFVKQLKQKKGNLRQSVTYEIAFSNSVLRVTVSLSAGERGLRYDMEADWNELAVEKESTPQLQFCLPLAYTAQSVCYDVPGGQLERRQVGHDVPAVLYAAPKPAEGTVGLVLTSDCKYGYRVFDDVLSLTLFHSGWRPDRRPDTGIHKISFGFGLTEDYTASALRAYAMRFAHPLYCYCNTIHGGDLPQKGSLLEITGADCAALKRSEDRQGIILRLTGGESTRIQCAAMDFGWITDILEAPVASIPCENGGLQPEIPTGSTRTVLLKKNG